MNISRRTMVRGVAGIVSGAILLPRTSMASVDDTINPELMPKDVMFSALAKAMEAAKSAGAEHTEVTMTRVLMQNLLQREKNVSRMHIANTTTISIGIRVLIRGRWGHSATNQFGSDEMVRIGKAACSNAKASSKHRPRHMEWIPAPSTVAEYITPGIDPFSVTQEEKIDYINAWRMSVNDFRDSKYEGVFQDCFIANTRNETAFINSSGSKLYSIIYAVQGGLPVLGRVRGMESLSAPQPQRVRGLDSQRAGWEVFRETNSIAQIPQLIAESADLSMIGIAPVDIGRYEIVCDAPTSASIITSTVVSAAEIDRAIGLEANATGTSYLGTNLTDHLGSVVGHNRLNISINRTAKRGLATIPWDAEGVSAKPFSLVKDGRLVNYLTNRELAPQLNDWYTKNGIEVGSNGSAYAGSGSSFPTICAANVKIEPGQDDIGVEDMIRDVKKGYLLTDMFSITSFQRKDGYINGMGREIINGKLRDYTRLGVLFSATDLLKKMNGLGGRKSSISIGIEGGKSQPYQGFYNTVESVPTRFSDVAIIDPNRKM